MNVRVITILAALVMAVPVGTATWFGPGTYEPDTTYDQNGGMMWSEATTSGGDKVYFNAYESELGPGANINSGTLGSRFHVPGLQWYQAIMGVWRDCNNDKSIGLSESASFTYSSALADTTICPVGSAFNDGTFTTEYLPVGYDRLDSAQSMFPGQIVDPDAKVWADFGLPGASPHGTCPLTPLPHGTTSNTGLAIRYVDCLAGKRITDTINANDPTGLLSFSDDNHPENGPSVLAQNSPVSVFGNPMTCQTGLMQLDSGEGLDNNGQYCRHGNDAAFSAWDCSRKTGVTNPTGIHHVDDPTGGAVNANGENLDDANNNNDIVWVANPAPATGDATGSYADGLNQTASGVHAGGGDATRDDTFVGGECGQINDNTAGDNTYSSVHQTVFFDADGQTAGSTQTKNKNENDMFFTYDNGAPSQFAAVNPDAPNAGGAPAVSEALQTTGALAGVPLTPGDPAWRSQIIFVTTPQSINRNTLQIVSAIYTTFYAKVGAATTSRGFAVPGDAVYAKEACGSDFSGVHNGWVCDSSTTSGNWYPDNPHDGTEAYEAYPGEHYQLLDIDCDDGTVARGSGVHASGVDVATDGGGPCADATN